MGQYYTVLLKKGNSRKTVMSGGYLKLMESSYITNALTDYVFNELYEYGPHRVAWLGDYANEEDDAFGGLTHEQYMKEYNAAWKKKVLNINLNKDVKLSLPVERLRKMSLVNHTKKTVLDLGWYIDSLRKRISRLINPLAILTACGNGRGLGDYYGTNMKLVGSWAFDQIEIMETEDVPENYTSENVLFIENFS